MPLPLRFAVHEKRFSRYAFGGSNRNRSIRLRAVPTLLRKLQRSAGNIYDAEVQKALMLSNIRSQAPDSA